MNLVYLTRGEGGIKLVHKKPAGVRISENHTLWFIRDFSFSIGKDASAFHYNGLEVVGVFDLDNPEHFAALMRAFESHLRQQLEKEVFLAVGDITPVKTDNKYPPAGPGGFHYTSIGSAIAKVFRHGDAFGDW